MKKKNKYRHTHIISEARHNQDQWHRAKRGPKHLVDISWDIRESHQKTWKVKRPHQYRTGKRGKKHSVKITEWRHLWKLIDYCDEHDIPYTYKEVKKFRWVKELILVPTNKYEWSWILDCYLKKPVYRWTGKYKRAYYIDHYIFTWWSDKDIGIEYIISDVGEIRIT